MDMEVRRMSNATPGVRRMSNARGGVRRMSNAMAFCRLRELWLQASGADWLPEKVEKAIEGAMYDVRPVLVPSTDLGDSGDVGFADGSTLRWDWDNGDLYCEGAQFTYPYGPSDVEEWGRMGVDPFWWDWATVGQDAVSKF